MSEVVRVVPGMVIPEDLQEGTAKREWMEKQLKPAREIMKQKPYHMRKTVECMSCSKLIACKGKPVEVDRCVNYEERNRDAR